MRVAGPARSAPLMEPAPRPAWRRLAERLRRKLQGDAAAANVLRMLAGNASAQILTLAAYPLLTRLYTPAQIGVLSALMAAVTIFAPTASLRIEMALPMSRSDREAGSVLAASAAALLLTTLLCTAALALLPPEWPGEMAPFARYRWFLPLALFAFGGYVIMVNEAARRNRFAEVARTRVMQALGGPASQIGFNLLGFGTPGLLFGYVIGQSSGTVGLAWRLLRGAHSPLRRLRWAAVKAAIARHRDFVLFSSWTGVVSAAATYLMTIAFAFIYGPAVGGFLFLGERVVMRPLLLISSAVLPVYTREVAQLQGPGLARLHGLFVAAVRRQALLALAWLLPIALAAPWAVPVVFGDAWAESARYIQVLAIGYFPTSVLHPVANTLQVLKAQKLSATLDLGRSLAVFGAIAAVAAGGLPPLAAALACSLVQAGAQGLVLAITWRRVRAISRAARP